MLINKKKYVLFLITFVVLITNNNVFSKNTYLKYSPSEDALSYAGNSVIMICDKPSSIGLTFYIMKKSVSKNSKLTTKDINNLCSLYLKGTTVIELSLKYEINRCVVYYHLNKNNLIVKQNTNISLHKLYDKLIKEFHPTLNGELKLTDLTFGSNKKIWWKCDVAEDHVWEAMINSRTGGTNCPCCRGLKVVMSNCLATTHPNIAKQWHPTKNNGLTPFDVVSNYAKKVWWKCDKEDDHEWEATAHSRVSGGHNCPCCSGRKSSLANCLATTHPNDAKQWHPTKNFPLTPFDVVSGSSTKKIWWKCDKDHNHEYEATVHNKTKIYSQLGCPICFGQKVILSNCLATTHPEIAKKWHPTKNLPLTPFDVTFGSGKKVWWKCSNNHEWITSVGGLVRGINDGGNGCPLCYDSNGENKIKNILDQINITYEIQKTFDDCKNTKKLRFDFYLPKYNVLIEYDGMQHFKPIKFFGGIKRFNDLNKHDNIKNEYASKNNIPLLRIPYTKFDSIEEEIKQFLEKII